MSQGSSRQLVTWAAARKEEVGETVGKRPQLGCFPVPTLQGTCQKTESFID